jgi:hypothetical protein
MNHALTAPSPNLSRKGRGDVTPLPLRKGLGKGCRRYTVRE